MSAAALQVVNLHVRCDHAHVLNSVSLYALSGEVVALLGRDGSGRRATLRAITGQTKARQGSVLVTGTETIHNRSSEINHLGLGMLPGSGGIFPHLTCEENLLLPNNKGDTLGGAMSLIQIYELCPDLDALRHTLGTRLSGAEKRMLAIARMLRTGASVFLMDDISDGLAPVMTQAFSNLILSLKKQGYTIIMGERNINFCSGLADRFYVMQNGQITDTFCADELPSRSAGLRTLLSDNPLDAH